MENVIYLVLGCFGRRDNGFVSCASVENRILQITSTLPDYNQAMEYFDACRLFDRPMFEMQAIRHFIFNIRDRFDQSPTGKRIWAESDFLLYQKFLIDHRLCGLYVKLILVDPNESSLKEEEEEEKRVFIKSFEPFSEEPKEKNRLRLIKGR